MQPQGDRYSVGGCFPQEPALPPPDQGSAGDPAEFSLFVGGCVGGYPFEVGDDR
jgi:hypothetical protein